MPVIPPPTMASSASTSSWSVGWFVPEVVSIQMESDWSKPGGFVMVSRAFRKRARKSARRSFRRKRERLHDPRPRADVKPSVRRDSEAAGNLSGWPAPSKNAARSIKRTEILFLIPDDYRGRRHERPIRRPFLGRLLLPPDLAALRVQRKEVACSGSRQNEQ